MEEVLRHDQRDGPGATASKRFETTTRSAQQGALDRLRRDGEDRATIVRRLQEQKLRNTRTNLVLGTDRVLYETDAMARQKDYALQGQPQQQPQPPGRQPPPPPPRPADLKRALQRTHFVLGEEAPLGGGEDLLDSDEEEERIEALYTPASRLPDPTGRLGEYTGRLNDEVKALITKSSVHWGEDALSYETSHRTGFPTYGDDATAAADLLIGRRQEIAAMKRALTATHFRLGGDAAATDYRTHYYSTFNEQPAAVAVKGAARQEQHRQPLVRTSEEIRSDLRRTHFLLGTAPGEYVTTAQAAMAASAAGGGGETGATARALARELKQDLSRSHLPLATDAEYM